MAQLKRITLQQIKGDLEIYFNWSANVLMPLIPGGADRFLEQNKSTIVKVAQQLLHDLSLTPHPIYRGIILKEKVDAIHPHHRLKYLSFSADRKVAEHFADIQGFGSGYINVAAQLGTHSYVIEYTPTLEEILFHYRLLSLLPYGEGFSLLGMKGTEEVKSLQRQKEIVILQPAAPFTQFSYKNFNRDGKA